MALPEARALRERLGSARKVAEAIRSAMPTAREAGRRKKGDVSQVGSWLRPRHSAFASTPLALSGADNLRHVPPQVSLEHLRGLREQAAALRVDMPEAANIGLALERLDIWQVRECTCMSCQLLSAVCTTHESPSLSLHSGARAAMPDSTHAPRPPCSRACARSPACARSWES